MFTPEYHNDKPLFDAIAAHGEAIAGLEVEASGAPSEKDVLRIREMITQVCCKMDLIEVGGKPAVRAARKKQLSRCDAIEVLLREKK